MNCCYECGIFLYGEGNYFYLTDCSHNPMNYYMTRSSCVNRVELCKVCYLSHNIEKYSKEVYHCKKHNNCICGYDYCTDDLLSKHTCMLCENKQHRIRKILFGKYCQLCRKPCDYINVCCQCFYDFQFFTKKDNPISNIIAATSYILNIPGILNICKEYLYVETFPRFPIITSRKREAFKCELSKCSTVTCKGFKHGHRDNVQRCYQHQ